MPNNILITPGSASIQFSGSAANTIRLQVEASGSIAFYGNSGSLFGISDSLSGSLMSVNDISGLPILEVFSDDRVVMGSFNRNTLVVTGSNVGIGTSTPQASLEVSGSIIATAFSGSLFGTASVATTLLGSVTSASYAETASLLLGSIESASYAATASVVLGSIQSSSYSDFAVSASYAATASLLLGSVDSASFATTASAADSITFIPATASYAISASIAITALTSSYFSGSVLFENGLIVTGSTVSTGGFTGSLQGTASWATNAVSSSFATTASYATTAQNVLGSITSASYAATASLLLGSVESASFATTASAATSITFTPATASFAISASWAPYGGLVTKVGSIANTTFAGNPRNAPVNFTTPFVNTSYAVVITGEDSRAWSIEGKVVGGFTASANSNTALAGTTYWVATAYGEV